MATAPQPRQPYFPSSRTKDCSCLAYPLNQGVLSRWVWRQWTWRLTLVGHWMFWMSITYAAVGSNSLELQAYVPAMYLFGIWVVAFACLGLVKPRASVRAQHIDRIGVGEALPVDIEVRQQRRMGLVPMTVVPHRLPAGLDAAPQEGIALPPLGKGQSHRARMVLQCARRGVHTWRGFRVETSFPFGLMRAFRIAAQDHQVLVFPKFTRLARLALPSGAKYHPGGVALASDLGEALEYIGNREYREGDSIRSIDWRATARLGIPIVREYKEEYFLRVAVILDTYVRPKRPVKSTAPPARGERLPQVVDYEPAKPADLDNFERAVSVCAGVSDYMARSDYIVDLFAAGPNLYHLTAGRSLAYLDQILDILACVGCSPTEPFEVLEPEILQYLSRITTIICVFMDWDETRRAFVERLRREGSGVRVIVVRDTPCTIDPLAVDLATPIRVVSAADFAAGVDEL